MKIKTMLYDGLMSVLGYTANAQNKFIDASLGYNALETAVTNSEGTDNQAFGVRNRALIAGDANIGPVSVGYSGLHDINDADINTYLSRNVARAGIKGIKTSAAVIVKATNKDILDTKVGIRDQYLTGLLGLYGWVDITANSKAANITTFLGKEVAKGTSVEVFNSLETPYKDARSNYTEFQVNHDIASHLAAFLRAEVSNLKFQKGTYMAGISVKL